MRKFFHLVLFVVLLTAGMALTSTPAQAADTGNAAPQTGKIVSDEPGTNAPNILNGTVYSIAKVGNTIVVGGQFSQVQNYNTSTTLTRVGVLAFDATTGKLLTSFAPDPLGTVYKVLPAADGKSVYVAGSFNSAGGQSMPGALFKINVTTGVIDPHVQGPGHQRGHPRPRARRQPLVHLGQVHPHQRRRAEGPGHRLRRHRQA